MLQHFFIFKTWIYYIKILEWCSQSMQQIQGFMYALHRSYWLTTNWVWVCVINTQCFIFIATGDRCEQFVSHVWHIYSDTTQSQMALMAYLVLLKGGNIGCCKYLSLFSRSHALKSVCSLQRNDHLWDIKAHFEGGSSFCWFVACT